MGFVSDLFSNKQQQQSNTNSSQQGTSTTQNNAWDQIQPYFQSFLNQYSPGNYSQTGTPNLFQSEAGANQGQVANPGTLQPAFAAANGVAGSGITTADINSYMSPYIQNVVNPTLQAQAIQNKQALSDLDGNHAMKGALGNNTGASAAYLAGVQPGQQAQIASLYDQGYNQAANTAASSAGLKLQGANAAGSLSNAATGANQGLFNVGQGIFNTSLTPYTLLNQGVAGLTGLGGLAGSTVNTSGTSTGTSNGTTTSSPSLGSILLGGLGTLFSGFKEGGAVSSYADGGGVSPAAMMPFMPGDDMATKVGKSFKMLHGLKTAAQGGRVENYDIGGSVPFGPWNQPSPIGTEDGGPIGNWETTVTPEPAVAPFNTQKVGQSVMGMADKLGQTPQVNMGDNGLGQSQAGLSSFLGGLSQSVRPAYEDGGMVPDYGDDDDAPSSGFSLPSFLSFSKPPSPPPQRPMVDAASTPNASGWLPTYSTGIWAGQAASPMQRFGAALAQIGDGPFAPFGKAVMEQQNARLKDLEAQRAAGALGLQSEQLKLAQAKNPAEIAALEAQAQLARTNSDKTFLLELEKQKMLYAKEVELAKMAAQAKMVNEIMNKPPVTISTEAERAALPPGTPYTAPDGSPRIAQ